MNKGIDYGCGRTNVSPSGIRYGVIPINSVSQAWCDSSEPFYPNTCPHCGNEPASGRKITDLHRCPSCKKPLSENDFEYAEPSSYYIDDNDYTAESDDSGDIFITKSLYYTYSQFCSPCAPGAGYLLSPLDEKDENNRCYCFGHDFFEDNKAPYPVYSVETNELILPEKEA